MLQSELLGVAFAVGSSVFLAASRSVISRPIIGADPTLASFFTVITGLLLLCGMDVATGQVYGIGLLNPEVVLIFAVVGFVHFGLARQLLFVGTKEVGANISAILVSVVQVLGALIFAVVLLGEALTPSIAVGAALILGGASVIEGRSAARRRGGNSGRGYGASIGNGAITGFTPILIAYGLTIYPSVISAILVAYIAATLYYSVFADPRGLVAFVASAPKRGLVMFITAGVLSVASLVLRFWALIAAPVVLVVPILTASVLFTPMMTAGLSREYEVFGARTILGIAMSATGLLVLSLLGIAR